MHPSVLFYTFTVSLIQSSFLLVSVPRALKEVRSSGSKARDLLESKHLPEPTETEHTFHIYLQAFG